MYVLYQDKYCKITNFCIVINKYYFPLATSRTILYTDIQKISLESCLNVRHKWGLSTHFINNWFHYDGKRRGKQFFIAIHIKGRKVIPSFTPEDSVKVFEILRNLLTSKTEPGKKGQGNDEAQIQQIQHTQMMGQNYNQNQEELEEKPSEIQLNPTNAK